MNSENILEIKDLELTYETSDGVVHAVNGVNLSLQQGTTIGLVGETGAGKTTVAKAIMGIIPNPPGKIKAGEILFEGEDLLKKDAASMRKIRGNEISMIFQDPMTSLNPVMSVGDQIAEVIEVHQNVKKKEAFQKAKEMLEMVGIPADRAAEYPHQFSGGMKQRVVIAIALACNPQFLIADEPTTALDVTIQAQVLDLMTNLKKKMNTSMMLITHDLGVVAQICDTVAIMYAGEIVEYGTLREVFKETAHPYTEGLFGSIPSLTSNVKRLTPINGLMPDPMNLPTGCKFSPRCKYADEKCKKESPTMVQISGSHCAACWRIKKGEN